MLIARWRGWVGSLLRIHHTTEALYNDGPLKRKVPGCAFQKGCLMVVPHADAPPNAPLRQGRLHAWRAALTLGPESGGGRTYFRGSTRQEVQQKLAAAKRALEGGLPQLEGRQTVQQFLAPWLLVIKPTMERGAWRRHEEFVRLHIVPILGQTRMIQVTPQQIQALYADRLALGLPARPCITNLRQKAPRLQPGDEWRSDRARW
jgi:hypothetical protein